MDPDDLFMAMALALARRGRGKVSPNPMVGAVVAQGKEVLSQGYHRRLGGPHAEVEAIHPLKGDLSRATLYVTLEPCCHEGKTPPCTDLILRRRVRRVVVGTLDPNPQVSGRGVEILRKAGVEVRVGALEAECRGLNRVFFHWMEKGTPWVTLKWAQSLDGRIATASGHARWISSERSRKEAHTLRALHDAVLVGVGTVLADDPQLTVRHVRGRNPLRIILDSQLKIPRHARVLQLGPGRAETWMVCSQATDPQRIRHLQALGVRVVHCSEDPEGMLDVRRLLPELARSGVSSLLVEGGKRVLTSFLKAGAAQRIVCFVAPIILGKGVEAIEDLNVRRVEGGFRLGPWRTRRMGSDLMIEALLHPL